jgi:hypothetical protein
MHEKASVKKSMEGRRRKYKKHVEKQGKQGEHDRFY